MRAGENDQLQHAGIPGIDSKGLAKKKRRMPPSPDG
jgi:hypothetical protein